MAPAYHSFIAAGFGDDCDELIHRCLKHSPITYKIFSEIFRQMQMSCIYLERQTGAEIAELSEEVVNIAKRYLVANTSIFEESVAGLFLVYSLIKTQPFEDFAYLRLVEEDVPYIERIEQVARRDKRVDILYVLGKLLSENTRYFVAVRERGMEPSYRKYLEGCSDNDLGLRPKGVFLRQNEELDIIKELSALQVRYEHAKIPIKTNEVNYTDKNFADALGNSLKNIIAGVIEEPEGEGEQEGTARTIKEKAMKIKVNPVKHFMTIDERSQTKSTFNSEIKSPPGKIKTNSPTKPVNSKMSLQKVAPTAQKRKRKSSSSSNGDLESPQLSDHDSDFAELDLESFNRPQSPTDQTQLEIDSNLNLESLPCSITTDDNGKTIEIEIIDHMKKSTTTEPSRPKSLFQNAMEKPSKTKKEKRDLKKSILKSRFKRMGIGPVANFKS